MRHPKVNSEKLAQQLRKAAKGRPISEVANKAGIDISRVSRFLSGDFKKSTPKLEKLSSALGVKLGDYLIDSEDFECSSEIQGLLRKIIGRDRRKAGAAIRLLRSLEVLTVGKR